MEEKNKCPLCGLTSSDVKVHFGDYYDVECPRCKKYVCSGEALDEYNNLTNIKKTNICAWINYKYFLSKSSKPIIFSSKYEKKEDDQKYTIKIDEILEISPRTVGERLNKILNNIAIKSGEPGTKIPVTHDDIFLYYSCDTPQMFYYLKAIKANGWIECNLSIPGDILVTPEGWNRVVELEDKQPNTKQIFVAMSFSDDMNDLWDKGIRVGVRSAGYVPIRVDKQEHNEKICDLIISEIRKSCLLIADVTMHKQGVYFEAGYALGIGLPVIWCCHEDDLKNAHFDTRQYNHIVWKSPDDLSIKLQRRIWATF